MDKTESLKKLEAWIYHVMKNIPDTKIYWEENVKRGKKLGEWTYWEQHGDKYRSLNEKGYFASNDMQYVGHIDPNDPANSYYVRLQSIPYTSDARGSIEPNATWEGYNQHKINPDGTYSYIWGGVELYDVTDLVLGNPARFKFVNWNKTPFRVK